MAAGKERLKEQEKKPQRAGEPGSVGEKAEET